MQTNKLCQRRELTKHSRALRPFRLVTVTESNAYSRLPNVVEPVR